MATFPILTADGDTIVTGDLPTGFAVMVEGGSTPVTIGQLMVPTDGRFGPTGGVLISETTGLVTTSLTLPACEQGATLPNGIFALGDDVVSGSATSNTVSIDLYNLDFSLIAVVPITSTGHLRPIMGNQHDAFYAATNTLGYDIVKIQASDGTILDTWLAIDSTTVMNIGAVSSDDAILYYTKNVLNPAIKRYDLVARAPLSDLVANLGSQAGHYACWLDATSELLIVAKPTGGGGSGGNWAIQRWETAGGTLQMTYPLGAAQDGGENVCLGIDANDQSTFWVRVFTDGTGVTSTLMNIRVSDGLQLASFTIQNKDLGGDVPSSCPLMVLSSLGTVTTTFPIRRLRRFAL